MTLPQAESKRFVPVKVMKKEAPIPGKLQDIQIKLIGVRGWHCCQPLL